MLDSGLCFYESVQGKCKAQFTLKVSWILQLALTGHYYAAKVIPGKGVIFVKWYKKRDSWLSDRNQEKKPHGLLIHMTMEGWRCSCSIIIWLVWATCGGERERDLPFAVSCQEDLTPIHVPLKVGIWLTEQESNPKQRCGFAHRAEDPSEYFCPCFREQWCSHLRKTMSHSPRGMACSSAS